jgi:hypothetical protein
VLLGAHCRSSKTVACWGTSDSRPTGASESVSPPTLSSREEENVVPSKAAPALEMMAMTFELFRLDDTVVVTLKDYFEDIEECIPSEGSLLSGNARRVVGLLSHPQTTQEKRRAVYEHTTISNGSTRFHKPM